MVTSSESDLPAGAGSDDDLFNDVVQLCSDRLRVLLQDVTLNVFDGFGELACFVENSLRIQLDAFSSVELQSMESSFTML